MFVERLELISLAAETVATPYVSKPVKTGMSLDHSSPESRFTPGTSAKAASCNASGSAAPRAAHLRAAVGALTALLGEFSQQAPAKVCVPGRQPTLCPLTVFASIALTALSAVCASTALNAASAVSACAAFGTWPRVSSLMSAPVSGAVIAALRSTPGFNRLAGIERGFNRLPGID